MNESPDLPDISELMKQAHVQYRRKNFEKAIVIYKQILQAEPNHFQALKKLGYSYYRALKVKDDLTQRENFYLINAADYLSKAIQVEPNHFRLLEECAINHKLLKQYDQAIEYYQRALTIQPTNAQILIDLGDLYETLDDFDNALLYYHRALKNTLKIDKLYGVVLQLLIAVYQKIGDPENVRKYNLEKDAYHRL